MSGIPAVILIGGEGTRLRPLTLETPKPLLPVANRPFLTYQFEQLRRHGIRDVILCTAYKPSVFRRVLGDGRRYGVRIRYVRETTPLGTAGGAKNAEPHVRGTALVLNGDVFNEMDLRAFLALHKKRGADATISLTPVDDPTRFGLVETNGDGRVKRFLEKPSPAEVTCNTINAGTYAFEPSVFQAIPAGKPYSVERQLFPGLLARGRPLFAFARSGYWMDIGTVEKYLEANRDVLQGRTPHAPAGRRKGKVWLEPGARLASGAKVEGPLALGRGARVESGATLRGAVAIGARCVIGRDALLEDCVLLDDVKVGERAHLVRCVVGTRSKIGADSRFGGAALGAGTVLPRYSRA